MVKLDGIGAKALFEGPGIGWDGFLVLDSFFSEIDKDEVDLSVNLGKGIVTYYPIWASPMDTVCESSMGIAIALEGGLGAIHLNNTPEEAAREINLVKRFENGFIEEPLTVSPDTTIDELVHLAETKGISSYPVTHDGTSDGRLVGIITKSDYSRKKHSHMRVKDRMVSDVIKLTLPFRSDDHLSEANDLLIDSRNPILPIVDSKDNLQYIVTRSDIEKNEDYPHSTKDENKQLRVLFACGTKDEEYDRIDKCFAAGADGVIVDTSQGYTKFPTAMLDYIYRKFPDKLLVGGNISTTMGAKKLAKHHIDVARIGQGIGSICTTQGTLGKGRSQPNAVYHSCKALRKQGILGLADGAIKSAADIYKALAIGGNSVMVGNLIAGCDESPGEVIIDKATNLPVKRYRGMGSAEVLNERETRDYSAIAQGVSGTVVYTGSIHMYIPKIMETVKESFFLDNCRNIEEIHKKLYSGRLRFEALSSTAMLESRPHDLVRYD